MLALVVLPVTVWVSVLWQSDIYSANICKIVI